MTTTKHKTASTFQTILEAGPVTGIGSQEPIDVINQKGSWLAKPKRKPGRPAKPRPAKPSRPLAMLDGVNVTVKLMPDILATVDDVATAQGVSRSTWIREAIERALEIKS